MSNNDAAASSWRLISAFSIAALLGAARPAANGLDGVVFHFVETTD
jgi:hypothetical protein